MTKGRKKPIQPNARKAAAPREEQAGTHERSASPSESKRQAANFPVVGIGASAGGLEALTEFFSNTAAESGMAYVVITHQQPGRASLLPELLARHTSLPVEEIADGMSAKPDHIYVGPPGRNVAIENGLLLLTAFDKQAHLHLPIDHFFRSLAVDQKERAIGIVLSGTGTDGTLGVNAIKGASGMVMVQSEADAAYAGMPHSALATGMVDYALPARELPVQLAAYGKGVRKISPESSVVESPEAMRHVFSLLRSHTGHDFSGYKANTIRRRVERRMNLHQLKDVEEYAGYMRANPREIELLFRELLIGVTSFFRDPAAFEALAQTALPQILSGKPESYVVRVWVAGCSTGEEAYSLAIVLRECMDRLNLHHTVQIFATDLDKFAIDVARTGLYPDGIAADVDPARLERYFVHEDSGYRIRKDIREMVIFAPQNVIEDPPFTKLDLVACRNLLIYLDSAMQQRVLPTFHYALREGGILFLGSSETIGGFGDLFQALDNKARVYQRKEGASSGRYAPGLRFLDRIPVSDARLRPVPDGDSDVALLAGKLMLSELVPPCVLANERGDILHIHGRTGRFLEPAPGPQKTNNIFSMARDGLALQLSSAFRKAAALENESVQRSIRLASNGDEFEFDLRVRQLNEPDLLRGLFLVVFDRERKPLPAEALRSDAAEPPSARVAELEKELQYTREGHQATIEELETTNEELRSTNEELQSTNEELQSTNEELETSREEMQSLNEELQAVNAEIQEKMNELANTNDDMKNLLNGTNIATIFLDDDLNIKRFTAQAKEVVRVIPSDIGRPLADLASRLHYPGLIDDAQDVIRTLVPREVEVQGSEGRWFLVRILPYRTAENSIEGLVLTFVDITMTKGLQESERRLLRALEHSPTIISEQDLDLRFRWLTASSQHDADFGKLVGKTDAELYSREQAEALAAIKRSVLDAGKPRREQLQFASGGRTRLIDLYVEPLLDETNSVAGVSCVTTDITLPIT